MRKATCSYLITCLLLFTWLIGFLAASEQPATLDRPAKLLGHLRLDWGVGLDLIVLVSLPFQ